MHKDTAAFFLPNYTVSNMLALSMAQINSSAAATVLLLNDSNYTVFSYTAANATMEEQNETTVVKTAAPRLSTEMPVWLIPCYSIILLFAVVGNLLVISTLMQNRRMRTITNLFLLNLAISDILLGVFCMPVTLVGTLLRHFIFGEFFCKLIQFSQATSVAVSSWTLVAISCERYYAICHPLRSRTWQTINHAYKIIGFIWLGSIICMTPIAVFSQLRPTSRQGYRKCREVWPKDALGYERSYNIFLDLILLVLPLLILCFAYILITRTLYIGMKNERAMIFGNSSSKGNLEKADTVDIVAATTTLTPASGFSINMSFRWHSGRSGNTSYASSTAERNLIYQQQQHLMAHDAQPGNGKRKLLASSSGRQHLYCMRSMSMKSLSRNGSSGMGSGNSSKCRSSCGTLTPLAQASLLPTSTTTTSVTQSMIVTNVPQQQRFKLHPQRQLQDEDRYNDSTANLRGPDTALRRTNTTKNLESKRRVVKMMFVLVLEFFICWTPLYVINTLAMFLGPVLYEYIDYTSISFLQLLAYSSSCCNPITYCFMNASFRRAFLDTFRGMQLSSGCCGRKRFKNTTNLSLAGNSITLASSGTIMTTNTVLDSPRL